MKDSCTSNKNGDWDVGFPRDHFNHVLTGNRNILKIGQRIHQIQKGAVQILTSVIANSLVFRISQLIRNIKELSILTIQV